MYDELVKRLRNEAETERYLLPHSDNGTAVLLDAAADAIEELTALSRRQEVELVELTGELASKPRWIPVTERLPENGKYVLAYSADDDYMTVEARHKFETFQITHWMLLPQPPEEG